MSMIQRIIKRTARTNEHNFIRHVRLIEYFRKTKMYSFCKKKKKTEKV